MTPYRTPSDQHRAAQSAIDNASPADDTEPGPIWGDQSEIETTLIDSEFFASECAEIMADFLCSWRDKYAEAKLMRLMRVLADRCHKHIDDTEADL